jgi:hypothetical protein
MKTTNYLRFPTEEAWNEAALTLGVAVTNQVLVTEATEDSPAVYEDQTTWSYYTHEHAIDVVGIIYNDDGVYNEETGEVITPPTAMEGWHVNYKTDALPDALTEYIVTPSSPHRKFAGD